MTKTILVAALATLALTTGIAAPPKKSGKRNKKEVVSKKSSKKSSSQKSISKKSKRDRDDEDRVVKTSRDRRKSYARIAATEKKTVSSPIVIGRGSVTGININVRSGPSTESSVVTKVSGGDVKILAQKGSWYKLRFAYGTEGWVRDDNLKVALKKYSAPTPVPVAKKQGTPATVQNAVAKTADTEETRYVTLVDRKVTVRKGPSDSNSAVTTVRGGRAEVKDKWGSWVKLQFQYGTIGWVRSEACEFPENFSYKSDTNRPKVAKKQPEKPILPPVKPPVDEVKTDQIDAQKDDASKNDQSKDDQSKVDQVKSDQLGKDDQKTDDGKVIEITDQDMKNAEINALKMADSEPKKAEVGVRYATINSSSVNVRKGPSTTNSTVAKVAGGTARVIDQRGDWYQLRFSGGTVGWVRKDLLTISENGMPTKPAVVPVAEPGDEDTIDKLVRAARGFTGVRYSYGSANRGATDCSGFTLQSFKAIGINLPRTARQQIYCGNKVSRDNLEKGDLIFFNTRGFVSHVGIYLGGGRFIHASSGGGKVQENNLGDGYYSKRFIGARRVIKPKK